MQPKRKATGKGIVTVRLNRDEWSYDPGLPLGSPGGFGAVFLGRGSDGGEVAVKRLHVSAAAAAHRELRIAEELAGRPLKHVMPVLDSGQDADSDQYFIIMPRADQSLQASIDVNGAVPEREAAEILLQIAFGLGEVSDLVHRDLKPGNVLRHEGRWKVADFGIARFIAESTSLQTLKEGLTPAYAAPEQWRVERATAATDVYALGCVAVTLLTGRPPFSGSMEGVRRAHLEQVPASITEATPLMRSLVAMMLRKAPESRPGRDRVHAILSDVLKASEAMKRAPLAHNELAAVGAKIAEKESQHEAAERKARAERDERVRLAAEARRILQAASEELLARIRAAAPAVKQGVELSGLRIYLGSATLEVYLPTADIVIPKDAFPRSGWDVVARGEIRVKQSTPPYDWEASLWYGRLKNGEDWRWHEVGYMDHPMMRSRRRFAPFAVGVEDADNAAGPGMGVVQFAYNPRPIDDEHLDSFCERWSRLLAQAAGGQLEYPRVLPLNNF